MAIFLLILIFFVYVIPYFWANLHLTNQNLLLNNVVAKLDSQRSKFDFHYVQIQPQVVRNQFPAPKIDSQGHDFDSQRIKIDFQRLKIDSQRPKTDFLSQKTWLPEAQNRLPKANSQLLRAQIRTRSSKLTGRGPIYFQVAKSDSQSPKIHSQRGNNGSSKIDYQGTNSPSKNQKSTSRGPNWTHRGPKLTPSDLKWHFQVPTNDSQRPTIEQSLKNRLSEVKNDSHRQKSTPIGPKLTLRYQKLNFCCKNLLPNAQT